MLTLKRFRVTKFRSVQDSGWIDTADVTALIGTNESGKTNLLIPLWKLNPAKDGEIDPVADYPRASFNQMRGAGMNTVFIQAEFVADDELQAWLANATGHDADEFTTVVVSRRYDGAYELEFPHVILSRDTPKTAVTDLLNAAINDLASDKAAQKELPLQGTVLAAISGVLAEIEGHAGGRVDAAALQEILERLTTVSVADADAHSTTVPRLKGLIDKIETMAEEITAPAPNEEPDVLEHVIDSLPRFVYYSNYGNLDSEIYLPHVIANLARKDLGPKEAAKARTLRVLFEFVGLSPAEILELGKAAAPAVAPATAPTQQAIDEGNRRTKQRDILLRSADTGLTKSFQSWWKQGDYRFRFAADGDHFRIWVSDERRPEDIELESRSTGLQWFFSFFLVFLVERENAHRGAILLLDEPGLTLHPLSQRDLSLFFSDLSATNPIIYTTHSPFMIDQDRIDCVRAVYVDQNGATAVSSDLRANSITTPEGRSIYAVHAALGLSVSDAMLQGCTSVMVEGPSDQFYLTAIKTVLVARKKISPRRELIFVPAGGAKGVNTLAPLLAARDEAPPIVLLDDDQQGRQFADALKRSPLYARAKERVLSTRDFVGFDFAETEDLLHEQVVAAAQRSLRGPDDDFGDVATTGTPIVPQVEAYAAKHGLKLETGWKVDLARQVKLRLLRDVDKIPDQVLDNWAALFARLDAAPVAATKPK